MAIPWRTRTTILRYGATAVELAGSRIVTADPLRLMTDLTNYQQSAPEEGVSSDTVRRRLVAAQGLGSLPPLRV